MKSVKIICFGLSLLLTSLCSAAPEDDVRSTAMLWLNGISKGDADYMVSLYDTDAILHGTVSPVLREGSGLIREYFAAIEDSPPTMFFVEPMHIRVFADTAVNTGNYGVRLTPGADPILMRYSFVYHKRGDEWLIVDHHSSVMPE